MLSDTTHMLCHLTTTFTTHNQLLIYGSATLEVLPHNTLKAPSFPHSFTGAQECAEITLVAPTLTKYLWLIALLQFPYQHLLFCTEHLTAEFKDILNAMGI